MKNDDSVHRLIKLYFDGETTLAQERQLKELLARTTSEDSDIAEARAVLSVTARCAVPRRRARHRGAVRMIVTVAATFVLIALGTVGVLTRGDAKEDGQMIAYVNGHCVTDEEDVFAVMHEQLAPIGLAESSVNAEVEAQFDAIRDAFNQL